MAARKNLISFLVTIAVVFVFLMGIWFLTSAGPAGLEKENAKWVEKGCWTYVSQCKSSGQMVGCELKSEHSTPFVLDGKVYKPYSVCKAK